MANPALDTDTYKPLPPLDINVDSQTASNPPSEYTAQTRAAQASFGMGPMLPDRGELTRMFLQGDEGKIRQQSATMLDNMRQDAITRKVTDLVGSPDFGQPDTGPAITEAVKRLINAGSISTDPGSVFEETYAHKIATALDRNAPAGNNLTQEARSELDQEADKAIGLGQDYYSKTFYAGKLYQDMADLSKNSSWTSYLTDKFLSSLQVYNEVRQRGNTGGFFEGGLLGGLGEQQEAQYQDLLKLPMDQYKVKLDSIIENLKSNPDEAMMFLEGLASPSISRRGAQNAFSLFAPMDIAGVTKVGFKVGRGLFLRNQLNRAIQTQITAIEAAPKTLPPEVVTAAASGDLNTATVVKAATDAQDLIKGIQHAPTRQALDGLVSGLKDQISEVEKDPGNYGQEGVNRIREHTLGFINNIINGVNNIVQVERIPGFLASKEATAKYYASLQKLYPGFSNSITDLGSPIKIEWDPALNTYHIPIYFGDGPKAFSTPQTAFNKAIMEGLNPANVTRLHEINEEFGTRSSSLTQKINELKAQLREPSNPSTAELDHAGIRKDLEAAEKEFDTLLSWHADQLAGDSGPMPLNKQITKTFQGGFDVVQQGNGFYIKVVKPVNETHNIIRDSLLNPDAKGVWHGDRRTFIQWLQNAPMETQENTTPHGFFKDSWFGWGRTPDEVLSAMHTGNRKVAAYAPAVFQKILKENAKYLDDLFSGVIREDPVTGERIGYVKARVNAVMKGTYWSPTRSKLFANGTRWNRFVQMLNHGVKLMDDQLDSNGQPLQGYFFKTPGEFERNYTNLFSRAPDPQETAAYFAFRRQYEADKIFREMQMYKAAHRLGTEEHSISYFDDNKQKISSPYFPGIKLDHMPGGDDNVVIFSNKGAKWLGKANEYIASHKKFQDEVAQGKWHVVRVFAADQRPLNGFNAIGDQKIHYVVTPLATDTRPLQLGNMLPRRGGGHVIYDYDHYIKQANVRDDGFGNNVYEGDRTIMPIKNRAMGRKISQHLDQVRQYLKDGDEANAQRYSVANLPVEWKEVKSWFDQKHLNLDEPIQVVPKNRNIIDMDNKLAERWQGKKFKDATRGGSPAELLKTQFSNQRDADLMYTINDYGTASRPLYKYEPAELVDPMTTLNRSLKQISESNFMDDYKLYSVEHWLQEAWEHLDTPFDKPKEEVMKSPFYYFYNGKYKPAVTAGKKSELELRRFQIKQFMGNPSETQSMMNSWSQDLADSAYEDRFYQRTILGNRFSMAPSWAIHELPNALQKLRTATYHSTIGLFNWAQIFAQNMNYVTMSGLAGPTRGSQGAVGAMLHQYARLLGPSEDMLLQLDKVATNLGLFKAGEWKEAFETLRKTGFDVVGGEHQSLERIYNPTVVTSGANKFLGFGDIFFKGGERHARFGAWYIAHKEQRALNPTGRLTNKDLVQMLDRADFLAGNMSRASKSVLQNGLGAFPTQFLGYTMRVAEQFTGSRIGWKARARLMGAFSLAFGAPQAASLAGLPMDKYIREYELYHGYQTGDNFWKDVVMNGIPAVTFALVSGAGDWQAGTQPNVGQRYGSPGLDILRDTLSGDKKMLKIVSGATGSFLGNLIDSSSGFARATYAAINDDTSFFKLLPSEAAKSVNAVSSIAYTKRWWSAINDGKWLSRNGTNLAQGAEQDITPAMASVLTATGTQPQGVADATLYSASHAWDLEQQREAEKQFTEYWNKGMEAYTNDDPDMGETYAKYAMQTLVQNDYPLEKRPQLLQKAEANFPKSLRDKLDEVFLMHNPPPSQAETRQKILTREHEIYDIKRGQQ